MAAAAPAVPAHANVVFLFSHGAGAGIQSDLCQRWIAMLGGIAPVIPVQYAYLNGGRRRPPPALPILIDEHCRRFREIRADHPDAKIIMVGRSMGGRVACHASVQGQVDAAGLICLSYPLIAANKRTRRDQILRQVRLPILFVTGARDAMCPVPDLQALASTGMHCRTQIHIVDGAGHDLRPRPKDRGPSAEARCLDAIRQFVMEAVVGHAA